MRQIFILTLFFPAFLVSGQKRDKLFYTLHIQPEKTFYMDNYYPDLDSKLKSTFNYGISAGIPSNYPDRLNGDRDSKAKSTFNFGIGAGVHYELTKNLFIELGLDFISRQLISFAVFDQSALPPPHQSFTKEFVNIKSVSLRIVEIPLNLGLRLINKEMMDIYLSTEISGNLLLNSYYDVPAYEGTYWRFYMNGYSLNTGIGTDYKISQNCFVTARLAYSVINTVRKDNYLGITGRQSGISLSHEFLSFTLGVNVSNIYLSKNIHTLLLKRKYNKLEKAKRCPV